VKKSLAVVGWLGLSCVALSAAAAGTTAATTARISVSSSGRQSSVGGYLDAISATGRYVVFNSAATNLVRDDTNHAADVFVRDRERGRTTRVSLSSGGKQAHSGSGGGVISADGRYVAFSSDASNLVPGDTNDRPDIFVHDRKTGRTTRVSLSSAGRQGNGQSYGAVISTDGRYVVFSSDASNLVPHDTNHAADVFVHDRKTGRTTRVSVTSAGKQAEGFASGDGSNGPSISADGRYVAFQSDASNLVPHDTNKVVDIFVHDRKTGRTTRVSVSSSGEQTHGESFAASISADGRSVAFASLASNLVPGDTNQLTDVFVHDRKTGSTTRVSVSSSGGQGDNTSVDPAISASGRYVVFSSDASNLVAGDTNQLPDIFVRDRVAASTRRVSLTKLGGEANGAGGSLGADISANGRWVAFESGATNLVPGDTNNAPDVFLRGPLPG
jgi:Tol biopolymer transport system component